MITPLAPLDRRIPSWDSASLQPRRCPFCTSRGEPRFLRPDNLRVNFCSRCRSWFVSPAPDKRKLSEFYRTYFNQHRRAELQLHLTDRLLIKEMLALEPLSDVKVRAIASLVDLRGKRVLDAGFGLGQNMLLMTKLGAQVSGVDLDTDAVDFARLKLGLHSVRTGDLLTLKTRERYDLITLHDVVEHPLAPLTLLAKARTLLAHDGMISIWTPCAPDASVAVNPLLFRVDLEHMQYLSPTTCNVVARKLGFEIIHLDVTGQPRLKQVAALSGERPIRQSIKHAARNIVRFIPGMAELNALRRRIISVESAAGNYHLFCIFRRGSSRP